MVNEEGKLVEKLFFEAAKKIGVKLDLNLNFENPIDADPEAATVRVNPNKFYSAFKKLPGVNLEREIERALRHELAHIRLWPKFPNFKEIWCEMQYGKVPEDEDERARKFFLLAAYEAVQDYFIDFFLERYRPYIDNQFTFALDFANLPEDKRIQVVVNCIKARTLTPHFHIAQAILWSGIESTRFTSRLEPHESKLVTQIVGALNNLSKEDDIPEIAEKIALEYLDWLKRLKNKF